MKTFRIEVKRVTNAANRHGLIEFRLDALVVATRPQDDGQEPATVLSLSEADARVLMILLKKQIAEYDGKKAKSRF
mgnify:CR=1 FL=1